MLPTHSQQGKEPDYCKIAAVRPFFFSIFLTVLSNDALKKNQVHLKIDQLLQNKSYDKKISKGPVPENLKNEVYRYEKRNSHEPSAGFYFL